MPDLNGAQFPTPGSIKLKRNRTPDDRPGDYLSEDGKWLVERERKDRWHVHPGTGASSVVFPTLRDVNDYVNHPLDWEPEHKAAWLDGVVDGEA